MERGVSSKSHFLWAPERLREKPIPPVARTQRGPRGSASQAMGEVLGNCGSVGTEWKGVIDILELPVARLSLGEGRQGLEVDSPPPIAPEVS